MSKFKATETLNHRAHGGSINVRRRRDNQGNTYHTFQVQDADGNVTHQQNQPQYGYGHQGLYNALEAMGVQVPRYKHLVNLNYVCRFYDVKREADLLF